MASVKVARLHGPVFKVMQVIVYTFAMYMYMYMYVCTNLCCHIHMEKEKNWSFGLVPSSSF